MYIFTRSFGPRAADDQHDQEARLRDALHRIDPESPGPIHVINDNTSPITAPGTGGGGEGFERLRALVEAGQVDVLAVESADRLGRGVEGIELIYNLFKRGGRLVLADGEMEPGITAHDFLRAAAALYNGDSKNG